MSELVIRTSRVEPLGRFLRPSALIGDLWSHRDLIRQFASRDLMERHKGAVLGALWDVINPLIALGMYTVVFVFVFQSRWEQSEAMGLHERTAAPLIIFAGLSLFHVFSETANRAPGVVAGRPNLIRKVVFPLQILPVATVLTAVAHAAVACVVLLAALVVTTGRLPWTAVLLPAVLLPLVMLSLGVAWLVAALGVFLRDVRNVVGVVAQMALFMSPVFYPIERLEGKGVLRTIVGLNPFTSIVQGGQRVLLWGTQPDWASLGLVTLFAAAVMQAGYAFFMRTKRGMADVA